MMNSGYSKINIFFVDNIKLERYSEKLSNSRWHERCLQINFKYVYDLGKENIKTLILKMHIKVQMFLEKLKISVVQKVLM